MPPALVVLAGVEDAAVARAESHYYPRSNSEHCHHINFSMVSGTPSFLLPRICVTNVKPAERLSFLHRTTTTFHLPLLVSHMIEGLIGCFIQEWRSVSRVMNVTMMSALDWPYKCRTTTVIR